MPAHREPLGAAIDADPVVDVHHVVARLERHEIRDRDPGAEAAAGAPAAEAAEDLVIGEDAKADVTPQEPARQSSDFDLGVDLALGAAADQVAQMVPLAGIVTEDDGAGAGRRLRMEEGAQHSRVAAEALLGLHSEMNAGGVRRLPRLALRARPALIGELLAGDGRDLRGQGHRGIETPEDIRHPGCAADRLEIETRIARQLAGDGRPIEHERGRRRDELVVAQPLGIGVLELGPMALDALGEPPRGLEHGEHARGEVARHAPPSLVQKAGDPPHPDVVALVEELRRVELRIVGAAGGGAHRRRRGRGPGLVDHHLAAGQQHHLLDRPDRALGGGLELAQRHDLVAFELNAHRIRRAEAEDVDDATAASDVSLLFDERHPAVPEVREPVRELVGIEGISGRQGHDPAPEHFRGDDLGGEGNRGRDDDAGSPEEELRHRVDARIEDREVGRPHIVGGGLELRQVEHARRGEDRFQIVAEPLGCIFVAEHDQKRTVKNAMDLRQDECRR